MIIYAKNFEGGQTLFTNSANDNTTINKQAPMETVEVEMSEQEGWDVLNNPNNYELAIKQGAWVIEKK